MFLIRTAFWLTVVIFLIPINDEVARNAAGNDGIGTIEAIGAAQATISDMGGFCDRNPDVCSVGSKVATTFALKAQSGALMVYSLFEDEPAGPEAGSPASPAVPAAERGTLTPDDLEPAWQGPAGQNT